MNVYNGPSYNHGMHYHQPGGAPYPPPWSMHIPPPLDMRTGGSKREDPEPTVDKNMEDMRAYLRDLWGEREGNVTMICRRLQLRAHAAIIGRCPFFAKVTRSGFQEGESKVIVPNEREPEVISSMLRYLYGFKYEPLGAAADILQSVELYNLAEEFQLKSLKPSAAKAVRIWLVLLSQSLSHGESKRYF